MLDMVFEKTPNLTLKDAIYNAPVVEDAGLKSFPDLQDRIDSGEQEITCTVWEEETQSSYHTFSLADLSTTTMAQLFNLVPKSFDPIVLKFECVETIDVGEDEEDI
jgi:hypothetical protein